MQSHNWFLKWKQVSSFKTRLKPMLQFISLKPRFQSCFKTVLAARFFNISQHHKTTDLTAVTIWKKKIFFLSYQGHKTKGGDLRAKGGCNIYEVQRIIVMHAYIKPHSTHVELASCMLMMCYFSIHHWLLRLVRLLLKPLKNIQMNSYTLGGPYFSIPYNLLP